MSEGPPPDEAERPEAEKPRRIRFLRAVAALAGSAVVGQAAGLAATPILTRVYSPEAFGLLSVFLAVLSFGTVLGPLRYHFAILLPKRDGVAAAVLWLALLLPLGVALLFVLGSWLGGDLLPAQVRVPDSLLVLLGVTIVLASGVEVLSTWGVRIQAYGPIAWSRSLEGVLKPAAQLGSAAAGVGGAVGLVLGAALGRLVGVAALIAGLLKKGGWPRATVRVKEVARRYRRFALVAAPGAVVNSAGLQATPLALAFLYSPTIAGLFALCNRVVGLPSVVIGRAVGEVYGGELGRLAQRGVEAREEMYELFRETWTKVGKIALAPAAVLLAGGPWLFAVVFGPEWRDAGLYSQVMAPMLVLQESATVVSRTFSLLERQELQLQWSLLRLVLVLGGLIAAGSLGFSPFAAVCTFSATMSVAYVIQLVMCARSVRSFSGLAPVDDEQSGDEQDEREPGAP